jgi:hypothetical protein
MEDDMEVKVNGVELTLVKNTYTTTNRLALSLNDDEGPYAVITYNDPNVALGKDEILVKTWSENEFVLELLETGLFEDTGKRTPAGWCQGQVWKVKFDVNDLMEG